MTRYQDRQPVHACVPSQLGPVRAFHPSGLHYTFTAKSFLIEAAKLAQHPFRWSLMVDLLTVISAVLQLKLKAASARIKVAFRLDTLARSKAAAKRGVMTVLRACLETGSEAVGATSEDKLFFSCISSSTSFKSSSSSVLHTLSDTDGPSSSKLWSR